MPRVLMLVPAVDPPHGLVPMAAAGSDWDVVAAGPANPGQHVFQGFQPLRYWRPWASHLWNYYPGLSRVVDRVQPDLIHVHNEPWAIISQQVAASGHRFVVHGADNIYDHGPTLEQAARRAVTRRVLKAARGFASWNQPGLAKARQYGLPNVPTLVQPGVVPDPAIFRPDGPVDADARGCVLFVGRLVPEKGVDLLIRGMQGLNDRRRLLVVGEGPERAQLGRAAQEAGVPASFLGRLDRPIVAALMRAAGVVVIPTRTTPAYAEQFCLVALEAMMVGCPVVASSSGELPVLLGAAGHVFPEGDHVALAAALRAALGEEHPHEKGLTRARDFSLETIVAGLHDWWERCLSGDVRA